MFSALTTGAQLGALLVSLACQPAVIDGVNVSKCDENVVDSWVEPTRDELQACAMAASDLVSAGTTAWCEIVPASVLGASYTAPATDVPHYTF